MPSARVCSQSQGKIEFIDRAMKSTANGEINVPTRFADKTIRLVVRFVSVTQYGESVGGGADSGTSERGITVGTQSVDTRTFWRSDLKTVMRTPGAEGCRVVATSEKAGRTDQRTEMTVGIF